MSDLFDNHSFLSQIYKHDTLPLWKTDEFDFIRCVNVADWVYGLNISNLHAGNLRNNDVTGRYSKLFPNEKISYWADNKSTALAEIRKHGGNKNYLTFHAYDDATSTFPILDINEPLTIIDGRELEFHNILLKIENDEELTNGELKTIELIEKERPDCLAYDSVAKVGGVNFLFFERGFKKLALKTVKLYFGENESKNEAIVHCAYSSDYTPNIEEYGKYFEPIAKVATDNNYEHTEEYKLREENYEKSWNRFLGK